MDFYDLYVRVDEGLEEIAELGGRFGFSGLGIVHEGVEGVDAFIDGVNAAKEESEIDLLTCCLLDGDSEKELDDKIAKVRQKAEIVLVSGGDFDINSSAVRDSRVDILMHPEYKRRDPGMDHKTARMASENEVVVGISMESLMQTYGKVRSHVLNHLQKNLELCKKYNAEVAVTSGARDKYGLRDPRELASLPQVLGASRERSLEMVSSVPKEIVQRNRKKLEGKQKKKGLEETS